MAITKVSTELLKDNSVTINKLHSDTVVTVSDGLHNHVNDNNVPTSGAVAAYVSSQVTGANNWDLSFAWGDHSTYGYATETYVDNSIANVINSAPAALDTLNELAAALGDDPNFATTVSTQIGTAQSTANTALTNANSALAKDPTLTISGDASGSATFTNLGNATLSLTIADDSHNHIISNIDGLQATLDGKQAAGTYNTIIGTDTDIDTSGATIVDNIYVTDGVITSMGTRTLTLGDLGYTGATNANYITNNNQLTNGAGYISTGSTVLSQASWVNATKFKSAGDINQGAGNHSLQIYSDINNDAFMAFHISGDYAVHFGLDNTTNRLYVGGWSDPSKYQMWDSRDFSSTNISNWNTAYGWGNHSSAGYLTTSGKAADSNLLDGIDSSSFLRRDIAQTLTSGSKFAFHSGAGGTNFAANHYSMGVDIANGSWSNPHYSDLIIGYHTGIRIGASYSGIRFYNNSPTTDTDNTGNGNGIEALILTVGGAAGVNDTKVEGIGYAGESFNAPIFYDSNNTGYYLDPSGTSNLNVVTANDFYANNWFRNHNTNEGMYNQATGQHWYSDHDDWWNVAGGSAANGIRFRDEHAGTIRGHVYADNSNSVGFLDSDANWAIKHVRDSRTEFYINNVEYAEINADYLTHTSDIRSPLFYDSNNTGYYLNGDSTSRLNRVWANNLDLLAGAPYAVRFWDGSDNYSIRMSESSNSTYGGRVGGETTSDYNMYFTMTGGTNRGFVFRSSTGASSTVAGIDASGNGRFEGDVVAFSASDKRLKDNIKPIENALEKVNKISGVEFDWNSNQDTYAEGMHDIGVIAQEIEEVIPEVVKTRDNGYKAVKYEKIVPLLIEAIKEQQTQIDELKKLINKQ